MDPADINTLDQLAGALHQLRRDQRLSLQGLADAAARLPPRSGRQPALPRSTASDLVNAKSVPEVETVVTFLEACGIRSEEEQRPWLQSLERVVHQHQRRPPGAVRVRDARPRLLGVHAAIQVDQPSKHAKSEHGHRDELPPFVPRDFDTDLRTKLTVAGQQGGLVLLVGDSSVGKSRALFEAVRAVLPDWWLLHPGSAAELREFPSQSAGRTVVWLDEVQDYLDAPGGVPVGQVRGLIDAGAVMVATCWPDQHSRRAALPGRDQPDPYANDRRLLDLADVLHVSKAFSTDELRRAKDLAGTDYRIRVALDTPDAGFTQVMAAGPELIRQWDQAPAYAHAVITAALDARRVGAHAPLTRDYLDDAAPGYLEDWQIATAPADWLDEALVYATTLLHGAAATLTPVAAGMGRIAGYRVADYLDQHALRVRRTETLPDAAWQALIRHHDPEDTDSIANNAERRGRSREAIALFQQLVDDGCHVATYRLAALLAEQGQMEELRALADRVEPAAVALVRLLAEQGQVEELRALAEGDRRAAFELVDLLVKKGQVEELRARVEGGDGYAALRLAGWLAEQEQVEAAVELLRARAEGGDRLAAMELVCLLSKVGQVEVEVLPTRTDRRAAHRLMDRPTEQEQVDVLYARADRGDVDAAERLVDLLAEQGQMEVLRAGADGGDRYATIGLAQLLAKERQVAAAIDLLRARADRGDRLAAERLVDLLVVEGQIEELGREVVAGTAGAVSSLRRVRGRHSVRRVGCRTSAGS